MSSAWIDPSATDAGSNGAALSSLRMQCNCIALLSWHKQYTSRVQLATAVHCLYQQSNARMAQHAMQKAGALNRQLQPQRTTTVQAAFSHVAME